MRRRRALALCVVLSAVGCSASKSAVEPGRGLLSHDSNPPAGAKLWSKPTLQRGNRFTYVTAGIHQLAVQVTEVGDKGVELRGDGGAILRLSPELGEAGDGVADGSQGDVVKAPPDVTYHWPLWVGKRWSCHYVHHAPGRRPQQFVVEYHCDALEKIKVPAGEFECMRIWRRFRSPAREATPVFTTLIWYSDEVGFFVRRLNGGVVTELHAFQR